MVILFVLWGEFDHRGSFDQTQFFGWGLYNYFFASQKLI